MLLKISNTKPPIKGKLDTDVIKELRYGWRILKSFKFVVRYPSQSCPILTILVPIGLIITSLVFSYLSKLLFWGFIWFEGNLYIANNDLTYLPRPQASLLSPALPVFPLATAPGDEAVNISWHSSYHIRSRELTSIVIFFRLSLKARSKESGTCDTREFNRGKRTMWKRPRKQIFIKSVSILMELRKCWQQNSRYWHRLHVFPHLAPIACFPALGTGCVFVFEFWLVHCFYLSLMRLVK